MRRFDLRVYRQQSGLAFNHLYIADATSRQRFLFTGQGHNAFGFDLFLSDSMSYRWRQQSHNSYEKTEGKT
ncbi:hypothetical protein RA279_28970, partial [Pseudomonas syringae pv. tagetis]|uniref:hypothetical protein n=1 Tax=Pseudomonas syringae group genomosp. 7 TaxID=251699 RepID=UPI0037707693